MATENNNKSKTKVEMKMQELLNEGCFVYLDDSTGKSKKFNELPDWYDEDKFKKGQKFFHDYSFAMFFTKLCGLLTILVVPTMLNILKLTNMSSTPLTAYRRYMATIFHMTLWYDKDFNPESKSLQSLKTVRNTHTAASNRAANNKLNRISQADMVLTQFGFIGYAVMRPDILGNNISDEKLEGLVHLWRVVGYFLGVEDRFNLCSGTVEETREYCKLLVQDVFAPRLKEADESYKQMSSSLVSGMKVFQPFLNHSAFMTYIHEFCDVPVAENNNGVVLFTMTRFDKFMLNFIRFVLYTYQNIAFRLFHNALQRMSIYYTIKYFPFLAYKKFGFKEGHLPEHIIKIYN